MRHVTSLQWIFNIIKQDYDIKTLGINFISLSKITYDFKNKTSVGFYQRHRAHILQNAVLTGDVINWNNDRAHAADEIVGPEFKD